MRQDELPSIERGSLDVVATRFTPRASPRRRQVPEPMAKRHPTPPLTPRITETLRSAGGLTNIASVAQLLRGVIDESLETSVFAQTVARQASDPGWLSALGMAIREIGLLISDSGKDSAIDRQKELAHKAYRVAQQRQEELERCKIEKEELQAIISVRDREIAELHSEREFLSLFSTGVAGNSAPEQRRSLASVEGSVERMSVAKTGLQTIAGQVIDKKVTEDTPLDGRPSVFGLRWRSLCGATHMSSCLSMLYRDWGTASTLCPASGRVTEMRE